MARELLCSRVAANVISVALGVLCAAGLFRTLDPSRVLVFGNKEGLLRSHMI